jgi:hypothetical protein
MATMKKLKKLLALNAADPADTPTKRNPRPVNKRIVVKRAGRRTYLKGWVV